MKVKSRMVLYLIVAIVAIGVTYLSVELFFPRVATVEASLDGVTIIYEQNFFNRREGKILKLDDKPIYNGNYPIVISSFRLIA